jgi:transcriptional antiterminator RfaH
VPETVVDTLRSSEDAQTGLHTAPKHELKAGEAVAITAGPFEGLQGVFETNSGEERVAILLDVLGQARRVVLARANVAAA